MEYPVTLLEGIKKSIHQLISYTIPLHKEAACPDTMIPQYSWPY